MDELVAKWGWGRDKGSWFQRQGETCESATAEWCAMYVCMYVWEHL